MKMLTNNSTYKTKWTKVSRLKAGMKIAVRDSVADGVIWDDIVSIQSKGRERVYDIEVEGTHNFVGNNIVAHNTYIAGKLGLGTTTPEYDFVVGSGAAPASAQIPKGGLCVDDDGWCDASTPGRISAVSYITGASDLAENYHSSEALESGDIVSAAGETDVVKADALRGRAVIGIVSERPGMILGSVNGARGEGQYPIALSGRVPVKVDLEDGEIKTGDRISLSNILEGVGKKATSSEEYVGIALEEFNYDSKEDYTANVPSSFNISSTTSIWDGAFMRQVQENQIKVKRILVFAKLGQKKLALEDEPIIKNHEARITEGENKIADLDLRVKALENIVASTTQAGLAAGGQVGLSTGTDNPQAGQLVVSEGMDWVLSQFRQIGIYIAQGVIQAREFIAEKITARKVVTDFIEMKDSTTGETWCVRIANGEWDKFKGTCGEASVSSAQSATVVEPVLTPNEEPQTPSVVETATTTPVAEPVPATLVTSDVTNPTTATSTPVEPEPELAPAAEPAPVSIEQPATSTTTSAI